MSCCRITKAHVQCLRCGKTTVRSERRAELPDGTEGFLCVHCAHVVALVGA